MKNFIIIAGPCSIENMDMALSTANFLSQLKIEYFRANIYKIRTYPDSFQGLGIKGIPILREIKEKFSLKIVTEINDTGQLNKELLNIVDIIQIGARNMQNTHLLKSLGKINKPILLKRGISATLDEWVAAGKYIINSGNNNIIFCERGIRCYEHSTRNVLDINWPLILKERVNKPVILDPSHSCGNRKLVNKISLVSRFIGLDGIMVEVHPDPDNALSDGAQSLDFNTFTKLIKDLENIKPLSI